MQNKLKEHFDDILQKVQKPGRYIGHETNVVRKEITDDKVSVVLSYPDMYEIGMSYLGLRILYHLLNEDDNIVCERVFAPWEDMENELRSRNVKLFSLETRTPISEFDIIGFSLSYELTYTNVLNMLDLGGVPVRSSDRKDDDPIVIAGGACSYNPEPMSPFIDAFILGDGEEALPGFIKRFSELKKSIKGRKELLRALSEEKGVYVPSLYEAEYSGKKFKGLKPVDESVPGTIEKNVIKDINEAYYPVNQIVPLIKIVHDRIAVEIMRGCPHRCRFCQASAINRPVRIRSLENTRQICRETYRNTGYETVALLSLSSVNYPYLTDLMKGLGEDFPNREVGISIPSLRVNEAFYELPEMVSAIRKVGLTFAPESADNSIRSSLGKDIDLGVLCKSASLAFQHGWNRMKLYFMVGFPGETSEQMEQIITLSKEISNLKRSVSKGAAEIKVSINPFIPKPQTSFQWIGMRTKEELSLAKNMLMFHKSKKIKVEFSDIQQSLLEACMSRGDRKVSEAIYSAWKKGAKMDGWRDFFNFGLWRDSFRENDMEIEEYATRNYDLSDPLPWDHINTGTNKEQLKKELIKSGFYTN